MTTNTLSDQFTFYLKKQESLVEEYNGKIIVIKNCNVLGAYDTHLDAFTETIKTHARGTFIIQRVSKGNEAYTATFHSPVVSTG